MQRSGKVIGLSFSSFLSAGLGSICGRTGKVDNILWQGGMDIIK